MTTSLSRCEGEVFITLCTVRMSVENPSLWNTRITLAVGRSSGYCQYLHLCRANQINKKDMIEKCLLTREREIASPQKKAQTKKIF